MSENDKIENGAFNEETVEEAKKQASSGPKFEKSPDPMASVRKGATNIFDSMEGKTVSMKLYVGTIIGVVILMMLARCGG